MPQQRVRVIVVVLTVGLAVSWIVTFRAEQDKRRLGSALDEAHASLVDLEQERVRLEQELAGTTGSLEGQNVRVVVLQSELDELQTLLQDAEQEIARLQTEQSAVLAKNAELTEQFASVDAERQDLRARMSSLKELKVAIRTVKRELREQRRQVWLAKIEAQRAKDQQLLVSGNRGYVVHNGTSTFAASPKLRTRLQVRVLEPRTE
jgi:chromosome segregation ATPase